MNIIRVYNPFGLVQKAGSKNTKSKKYRNKSKRHIKNKHKKSLKNRK